MQYRVAKQRGFTIVELLIVIVVIAILATISVVAYGGIRERAVESKIKHDFGMLSRAIISARSANGQILKQITGNDETAGACRGGDPLTQDKETSNCWKTYKDALDKINAKAGTNFTINFVDPWGRPYAIDENEVTTVCAPDSLGTYAYPYVTGYHDTHYFAVTPSGQCLDI